MIMKQLYRKIVTIFTLTGLLTTSCDIINVTDVDPVYQVSEDKVITNIIKLKQYFMECTEVW